MFTRPTKAIRNKEEEKENDMVMMRWDPFREMRRLDQAFNRTWRRNGERPTEVGRWAVPLDVVVEDDKVMVKATLPGIKAEDIDVTVEDDLLVIKGETKEEREEHGEKYLLRERRAGNFYRAIRLPDDIDTEKVETAYADGVLTITFPKTEAKKAKRLEIKAA